LEKLDVDSQTTRERERVAVVESAEPAPAEQPAAEAESPTPPRSLKLRLADIRDECAGFTKDDIKMGNFTIKGHTFEAILSEVRPLLHKHGVDVEPNLVERTYTGNRCDVLVDFTFERTDDSDEKRTIRWGGAGTDNGDKAFAKAGTNCVKEMLKKRFLITDRDDAKEEEEKVEHKTDNEIGREESARAKQDRAKAIQQWAATFKAALTTAPTLDDVKRLERENREQLTAEDLPPITRQFFFELIQARKEALTHA
jgi:hypothetical protein